jgi:hypothetical protein
MPQQLFNFRISESEFAVPENEVLDEEYGDLS